MKASLSHLDICKIIIGEVEDKSPADNYGWTPLHWAAYDGRLDVCRLLIEYVEDKHPKNKFKKTPMDLAIQRNHIGIAQLFQA